MKSTRARAAAAPGLLLLLLSLFWVARTADIARRTSMTIDEHRNLYDGYRFLRTGRTVARPDIYDEQPPLGRLLLALPLASLDPALPDEDRPADREVGGERLFYTRGLAFVFANRVDGDRLLTRARYAGVGVGLVLGWVLAGVAWKRVGAWPAVFAFTLFVACPNLAAHAAVTNTDVAGALGFLAATLGLAALAARPGFARAITAGFLLAFALLAKLVTLVLVAALPLLLLPIASAPSAGRLAALEVRLPGGKRARALQARALALLLLGVAALAGIWAGFGFHEQGVGLPAAAVDPARLADRLLLRVRAVHLLPEAFWMNLFASIAHGTWWKHQGYLLGRATYAGSPWFYPLALAVKLPVATLVAVALGLVLLAARVRRATPFTVFLLVPPVLFSLVLLTTHVNIGIRHALPLLAFLFLAAAVAAGELLSHPGWGPGVAVVLASLALVEPLGSSHPFELAFFNRLAGGTAGGHRLLADSNLDWGQGLKALKDYLDREGSNGRLWLAYFGPPVVDAYGIHAEELPTLTRATRPGLTPAFDPADGKALLVVSANELLGLYRDEPSPWKDLLLRPRQALVGGSLWVFDVTRDAALRARIGDVYRQAHEPQRARLHYTGALGLDPGQPDALAGLSQLALDEDRGEEAAALLSRASPVTAPVEIARARLALSRGRPGEALLGLERAVALDPRSYDASLALALTVLVHGGRPSDVGLAAARRAVSLHPSGALAYDVVASYLARAGDWRGAAAWESLALDHAGNHEEYHRKWLDYRDRSGRDRSRR